MYFSHELPAARKWTKGDFFRCLAILVGHSIPPNARFRNDTPEEPI